MIALLITYLPEQEHLVQKHDADGSHKVYFRIPESHVDLIEAGVKSEEEFCVYHRRDNNVNFIHLGKTRNSIYMDVDGKNILNLFFPLDQVKKRTLFSSGGACPYVSAVATDCKYTGDAHEDDQVLYVEDSQAPDA